MTGLVLSGLIGYVLITFIIFWAFFLLTRQVWDVDPLTEVIKHRNLIFAQRALGFLLFGPLAGMLAILVMQEPGLRTGFVLQNAAQTGLWSIGLLAVLIPFNSQVAKTKANQAAYPQVRYRYWSFPFFVLNAVTWLVYLLGYEYLFRGFLFFPMVESQGVWAAISLNTVLYAVVHIPKGWREILGALPFGVVLCLAAYETGSFWVAFIAHGSQAVVNEYFSIRYNPEMVIGKEKASMSEEALRADKSLD